MGKKGNKRPVIKKIYPKTNISRAYYKHVLTTVEHDPLIKHSTIAVASMIIAINMLLGTMIWFAQFNPGNLLQTTGTVDKVTTNPSAPSSLKSTFIVFEYSSNTGQQHKVRQSTSSSNQYAKDQTINIGYSPKNPNFARILNKTSPSNLSIVLWLTPALIIPWFGLVALLRHHNRQELIWDAAEAADINED